MDWTQIINLLEALCLLLLVYHIRCLVKDKNAAECKIEALEKKLRDLSEDMIGTKTAVSVKLAELEARVNKLDDYKDDMRAFDDKMLVGLQGLLDYNMDTARGGNK